MRPDLRQGLEAMLFLADEPVALTTLADALELAPSAVADGLAAVAADYESAGRGMVVREVDGGWRMYTAPGAAPVLERFALAGRSGRLTQATLETLAVVAYKQPISRQAISDIRGVDADAAVRSLAARGLVDAVGRDPGPGQAILYGTTTAFLERLGVSSLDELPPLTEFLPESPAPDEPALDAIKEARRRLVGSGAASRQPTGDPTPTPLASPRTASQARGDMDELTDALEQAARSAMDQLHRAVTAVDDDARDDQGRAADEAGQDG